MSSVHITIMFVITVRRILEPIVTEMVWGRVLHNNFRRYARRGEMAILRRIHE